MDERKKRILNALITDYVATAEPVGSRALSKKYDLGVSSATIRNEMADLEELGYIVQPHTSAGRVPSQLGYRYYVDSLMEQELSITEVQQEYIHEVLANSVKEVDSLMRQTAQLISNLTNFTAIIVKPDITNGTLSRVNLMQIQEGQLLVVLINNNGAVFHKIIDLPMSITTVEIADLEKLLNEKLIGYSIEDITVTLLNHIAYDMLHQQAMLANALDLLQDMMTPQTKKDNIVVNGALNMLEQPEFQDTIKVKAVLEAIEADDILQDLIIQANDGTKIHIGAEIENDKINECSVITTPYIVNGKVLGNIGVLGPTRMDYAGVVAIVEAISKELSRLMEN